MANYGEKFIVLEQNIENMKIEIEKNLIKEKEETIKREKNLINSLKATIDIKFVLTEKKMKGNFEDITNKIENIKTTVDEINNKVSNMKPMIQPKVKPRIYV